MKTLISTERPLVKWYCSELMADLDCSSPVRRSLVVAIIDSAATSESAAIAFVDSSRPDHY